MCHSVPQIIALHFVQLWWYGSLPFTVPPDRPPRARRTGWSCVQPGVTDSWWQTPTDWAFRSHLQSPTPDWAFRSHSLSLAVTDPWGLPRSLGAQVLSCPGPELPKVLACTKSAIHDRINCRTTQVLNYTRIEKARWTENIFKFYSEKGLQPSRIGVYWIQQMSVMTLNKF